jgi:D-3-phosphoglycerate dehydrogenase / 2-oxoglutarate reductase
VTLALCTAPLDDPARDFLRDQLGWDVVERERIQADPLARAVIVEAEPIAGAELDGLPALRLIVCVRGEPVNVDLAAASERGIPVIHAPGRNADAVAEFTIGLIIALLRHIVVAHELVRSGALTEQRAVRVRDRRDVIWRPADPADPVPYRMFKGPGLATTTLGLCGLGTIGRRVGSLAKGLGMTVIGHDPAVVADVDGIPTVSLPELLAACDVLSLHARGTGPPIIGSTELAQLRPGCVLVNTARATILDYGALAEALSTGHLAAAALDVYPDEPLTPDDPLIGLDNVILTPHIAGASQNVVRQQWQIVTAALHALLIDGRAEGVPVRNPDTVSGFLANGGRDAVWNASACP